MTEEPRSLVLQRKAIPDHVEYAVLRALEKLPADRWGSAREFVEALEGATASSRGATAASRQRATAREGASWNARLRDPLMLALLGVAVASVGFAIWARRNAPRDTADIVRFTIPALLSERANSLGLGTLAISPDGRTLVYMGLGDDRRQQLMLRTLDDITVRPLPETGDATNPVFSPDGKWVAFVRSNQIFKVGVDGTRPQLLAPAVGIFGGMSWSSTGVIVVSGNTSVYAVPEGGGRSREISKPDRTRGEFYQISPVVADDAGVILYASSPTASVAGSKLAMMSLKTGERVVFDVAGAQPLGILDGTLAYVTSAGVIMGVPFDMRRKKMTGTPVQLVSDIVINNTSGLARASLARNGTLLYQSGTQAAQVMMVGADGAARVLLAESREYAFPRLSPDGRRLAIAVGSSDRRDVWLFDLGSQTMTRLTSEGAANDRPEWSPNGSRVLYRSERGDRTGIWSRPADLSAEATPLIGGAKIDVWEGVMSPDMRSVVYQLDTSGADIYYRGLTGDTTPHVVSNNSKAIEVMPRLSPDGRWVAFSTDESGRQEVVVQPFPGPGGRVQVSANGGAEPVWSRDGKRLFYRGDGHLLGARLATGPGFAIAARDTLFADVFQFAPNPHANYDVLADGAHFVFLKAATEGNMIVVANWKSFVKTRMAGSATK
jgi:serine/threonine-protein kinase